MSARRTPLDTWAARRLGAGDAALSRERLERHQLDQLRATIAWAYAHSPFYRPRLAGLAASGLAGLADLRRLPFTIADDIRRHGPRLLCVSQSDISRVVTLDSSGTTGAAKRLYFTPDDQQATIGFFQYGMANLAAAGDRVLILLPGERPGGVGALLAAALKRLGARPVPHGVIGSLPETLAVMARAEVNCLVGIPAQVLALARWAEKAGQAFPLKSVLLSTDHVPRAVVRTLERVWGCDVFEHYGMTELGLGGGTDCAAHAGYHLHEADFYFEIVDPLSGDPVPAGGEGEVVVTTLARRGMPLIRYRTGDLSRFLPGPCPCGSPLLRLERIAARKGGRVAVNGGGHFTLADLDEALFAVECVAGFTAAVDSFAGAATLAIAVLTVGRPAGEGVPELSAAVDGVPAIGTARRAGRLTVTVTTAPCTGILPPSAAKRAIVELSAADGKQKSILGQARENPPAR